MKKTIQVLCVGIIGSVAYGSEKINEIKKVIIPQLAQMIHDIDRSIAYYTEKDDANYVSLLLQRRAELETYMQSPDTVLFRKDISFNGRKSVVEAQAEFDKKKQQKGYVYPSIDNFYLNEIISAALSQANSQDPTFVKEYEKEKNRFALKAYRKDIDHITSDFVVPQIQNAVVELKRIKNRLLNDGRDISKINKRIDELSLYLADPQQLSWLITPGNSNNTSLNVAKELINQKEQQRGLLHVWEDNDYLTYLMEAVANEAGKKMKDKFGISPEQLDSLLRKKQPPSTFYSPTEVEFNPVQMLKNAFQAGVEWAKQKAVQFIDVPVERAYERMEGLAPMRRDYGIYSRYMQPPLQRMRQRAVESPVFNPEKRSQEAVRAFERLQQSGGGYQ